MVVIMQDQSDQSKHPGNGKTVKKKNQRRQITDSVFDNRSGDTPDKTGYQKIDIGAGANFQFLIINKFINSSIFNSFCSVVFISFSLTIFFDNSSGPKIVTKGILLALAYYSCFSSFIRSSG